MDNPKISSSFEKFFWIAFVITCLAIGFGLIIAGVKQ